MNTTSEPSASGGSKARPQAAAWCRAVIATASGIAAIYSFIQGRILIGQGCMNIMTGDILIWFVGIPTLFLCLTSGFIAVALFRNSVRGIKATLIFDALVVTALVAGLILWNGAYFLHGDYSDVGGQMHIGSIVAMVALLFSAEAAGLLYVCRDRQTAWRELGILAAALALIVIAWPIASNSHHLRHVQALREFASTQLFSIPVGTPVTVTRNANSSGGHSDHICFRGEKTLWGVSAQHDGTGWHFASGDNKEVVWASANTKAPKLESCAGALGYLSSVGVAAGKLGTNCVVKNDPSAHLTIYVIDSPVLGGSFEVTDFGHVDLHLSKPLVVPDRQ